MLKDFRLTSNESHLIRENTFALNEFLAPASLSKNIYHSIENGFKATINFIYEYSVHT